MNSKKVPSITRLLIVGNPQPTHVGRHFLNAAISAGIDARMCDTNRAFASNWPSRKINWWLRGHRPAALPSFSEEVADTCAEFSPDVLLATGICPINDSVLRSIGARGVIRANFLTDDPYNRAHRTSWFTQALHEYDYVFTPRQANISDLVNEGCQNVSYLQFGYAPELHYYDPPSTEEIDEFTSDVVFAGGADSDRVPFVEQLIREGFDVALYGGYWRHFTKTRPHSKGHGDAKTIRKAIAGGKVALCLVRQSNRDGHAMRTFEVPAMGGCALMQDTVEHRQIFGEEGEAVLYFSDADQLVAKTRLLLDDESARQRLRAASRDLITLGTNTYEDRLNSLLALVLPAGAERIAAHVN